MRQCGDCQLCCKLLPVRSVGKLAGERCKHQRHSKGCAVYRELERVSPECRLWSCRWLVEDDTADLRRPDRAHYVIDLMPDFVTLQNDETGELSHVEVVQIWIDPRFPDVHRDPALRAYLERRAEENIVGLVRWSDELGMVIFPPKLSSNGQWNERRSDTRTATHSAEELFRVLGGMSVAPGA